MYDLMPYFRHFIIIIIYSLTTGNSSSAAESTNISLPDFGRSNRPVDNDDASYRHLTLRSAGGDVTAGNDDVMARSAVMFITSGAFLVTKLKLYSTFNISLKVRHSLV